MEKRDNQIVDYKWLFVLFLLLALSGCSTDASANLLNLEGPLESVQNQLEELKTENKKLKQKVLEKESALDQNKQIIETLYSEREKMDRKLKSQSKTIDNLESQILHLEKELERQAALSKKVFLTFDDGPTKLTSQILNTLREYQVPATFFVIAQLAKQYPNVIQQTYEEGHMVLPHSYSHNYAIYSNQDAFFSDFYSAEDTLEQLLNIDIPPYFRFPGGATNQVSTKYGGEHFMANLTTEIQAIGYYYIDWNVDSGDTTPGVEEPYEIYERIVAQSIDKDFIVVLFHDLASNQSTADVLPKIIEYYKQEGYKFRSFCDITDSELDKMIELRIANRLIQSSTH